MVLNQTLFGEEEVPEPKPVKAPSRKSAPKENPAQLKLFYRPHEVKQMVSDSVDRGGDSMEELWEDKESEVNDNARSNGMFTNYSEMKRSIAKEGVQVPITIETQHDPKEPMVMGQGHHRVVMAEQVEKETGKHVYIPAVHATHWNETQSMVHGYEQSLAKKPIDTGGSRTDLVSHLRRGHYYDDDVEYFDPIDDPNFEVTGSKYEGRTDPPYMQKLSHTDLRRRHKNVHEMFDMPYRQNTAGKHFHKTGDA